MRLQLVKNDCNHNDHTFDDCLPEGRDADHDHASLRNLVKKKLLWNLWTGYTVPVFSKSGPGGPCKRFLWKLWTLYRVPIVLIKVKSVGICGSDISYFLKGSTGVGKIQFPHTLGHECSGTIVKTSEHSKFKLGDRVTVEPGYPCHMCKHCLSGQYNLCENISFMSSAKKLPYSDGAFSEYIVRPEGSVFVIPDSMSYDQAALLEPISVGYHAVQRSGIKAGQRAAILGCG